MVSLKLNVLSLRYSSWSMRPYLVLLQAGADFASETVSLAHMRDPTGPVESLDERRKLGCVHGLFPALQIDNHDDEETKNRQTTTTLIHESLAICEYVAERHPEAHLWPTDPLERARSRALACEMISGFSSLRNECSCSLFARVPSFAPSPATQRDVDRVMEIWTECLERSGGPYLFGAHFGIVDAMYYPVLTRFRTYGIALPTEHIQAYAQTVESTPAVLQLVKKARGEPSLALYDDYIKMLGGDPNKMLGGDPNKELLSS